MMATFLVMAQLTSFYIYNSTCIIIQIAYIGVGTGGGGGGEGGACAPPPPLPSLHKLLCNELDNET